MFNLGVRENQYLFLALLGGTAAVFAVYLLYAAFWRTRDDQPAAAVAANVRQGFLGWLFSFMPWILIVLYIGWLAYGLAYMFLTAANPPNW